MLGDRAEVEREIEELARKLGGGWRIEQNVMPVVVLTIVEAKRLAARQGTAAEVLKAMAEDGQLAEDVLIYLEAGMRDEWDCNLHDAGELGFGPPELALAARTGKIMAEYQQKEKA
jgi:hypothetical protein